MFWGVILEGGKKTTQKVEEPLRISMAALELPVPENDKVHSVFLEHRGQNYLLCSLSSGSGILQVPLSLELSSGSDIGLFVSGGSKKSKVHLTGFNLGYSTTGNITHSMITSTPREPAQKNHHSILVSEKKSIDGKKKKVSIQEHSEVFSTPNGGGVAGKKLTYVGDELYEDGEEDEEDEDDEDDFEGEQFELDDDDEDDDDDEGDEEEDEDSDDSDLMDEEESPIAKAKAGKASQVQSKNKSLDTSVSGSEKSKSPRKAEAGKKVVAEPKTPESKKEKSNSPRTPENMKTPEQNPKIKTPSSVGNTPMKFVTKGGVMVQEIRVGNGQPAKPGKMVNVNYVGRLKQNNKQFDAGGIKFRIGKGEVIKGWDIGVEGMKIGGKRKLIIPPQLGYGKRGAPPDIPPNSTLVFDVELKSVS